MLQSFEERVIASEDDTMFFKIMTVTLCRAALLSVEQHCYLQSSIVICRAAILFKENINP